MAEILINSQSPIKHQVFWNGEVASADSLPTVAIYDVTNDPAISPSIDPIQLIETVTSFVDENNPGLYYINVPYYLTNRNKVLRLDWRYTVGGTHVSKSDEVFVITPYVDFNHVQDLGFSMDSSDPNHKTYKEILQAEKYARKQIEQHTGQNFYLYDDVFVTYGQGSDILPLPAKIYGLHELYVNDILLIDNTSNINNWNYEVEISESGYGLKINRNNVIDNTVYVANGMVPPSINDSFGLFRQGSKYKVQGRFGWEKVPDNVELAAIELMKDYFSKDNVWRNKYVESISTFDWDFKYSGGAYEGTGNAYADSLLADYVLTAKVEII